MTRLDRGVKFRVKERMAIKVLVVEDDVFLQSAYRTKLTHSGFELETASDGEDALTKLQSFVPDVILLDLVMPRKDGFVTLAELKKIPDLQHIPVIVTTNLGQKEEMERAMSLGAVECVTKSNLSLDDIVHKIEQYAKH